MRTPFFILFTILALILALFVGLIAYYTYQPPMSEVRSQRSDVEVVSPPPARPVISAADPVRGDPAAPLTIVEFGDFFCDACAEVEPTLQKALKEYRGKVKLVWKDLPNTRRHALAQKAAEAARCAGEQNKFWEYHDHLLENQETPSEERLIAFARELGLNTTQFSDCLTSGRTSELVSRTFNEALLLRVDATPYFFIGDRRFSGAPNEHELREAIER